MDTADTPGTAELHLRPQFSELDRFDALLDRLSVVHRFDGELANAIRLCTHEIFTNIVSYGFESPDQDSPAVGVSVLVDEDGVVVRIRDQGTPYNPLHRADPDLPLSIEEATPGGLGIFLVKSFANDVRYTRQDGANLLELEF